MEQFLKSSCKKCSQAFTGVHEESSKGETTDYIFLGNQRRGEVLYENKFAIKGKQGLNNLSKEMDNLLRVHVREIHPLS